MDKPIQTQAELLDLLLPLLRAGCEIRLTPQPNAFGFIAADVQVIPPPSADPQAPLQEWEKIKTGATLSLPYRSDIDLYYHPEILTRILESANTFFVRRPPTAAS